MANKQQWLESRQTTKRMFIQGTLTLDTPAQFGSGDEGGFTDMPLQRDPLKGLPLLTGASIAGALRNYLREYERGYGWNERTDVKNKSLAEQLFGHLDNQKVRATVHSWLMVDDALGQLPDGAHTEIRDGVTIDPKTRTAKRNVRGKGFKYDLELLPAGATFTLNLEVWLKKGEEHLSSALALALQGFENGEIGLGRRKKRGLGACHVSAWKVWQYPMDTIDGLLGWLNHDPQTLEPRAKISDWLDVMNISNERQAFTVNATFELDGSLLIRSETGSEADVDMVHLHAWHDGAWKPILSGTSLAGALRGRALRIANTLLGETRGAQLVNATFGAPGEDESREGKRKAPTGSRISIAETLVHNGVDNLVQSRVKIDRFTGGSYPQALFSQQPVWSDGSLPTTITLQWQLRRSHRDASNARNEDFNAQVGLLLMVLKDLWTGDLPLGGESSVGRGRLLGKHADLSYGAQRWKIERATNGGGLQVDELDREGKRLGDGREVLERFAQALCKWQPAQKEGQSA